MSSPLDRLGDEERAKTEATSMPGWTDPMLATLTHDPFSDPDWIYERKLDGVRLLVFKDAGSQDPHGGGIRLMTRNRKNRNATYPELVDALAPMEGPGFIVDGEVVAFTGGKGGSGRLTSFSRLQDRIHVEDEGEARERAKRVAVHLYLFDILWVDGADVTGLPLRTRKRLLHAAVDFDGPIHFTPHRNEEGVAYWKEACRRGWEGVIAKDARSTYVHSRSTKWLKFKCVHRQEFVVGGFTEPDGERVGFGALLLGTYEDGKLVYRGKVGTGWDDETLRDLRSRMDRLERKTTPFNAAPEAVGEGDGGGGETGGKGPGKETPDGDLPSGPDIHWVTPRLVAQVGFTEWTDDGRLRHPRYLGLRKDKAPEDVVRERPS